MLSFIAYLACLGLATALPPTVNSSLILNQCCDSPGQDYFVSPAGFPLKVMVRNSLTSPVSHNGHFGACWFSTISYVLIVVQVPLAWTATSVFIKLNIADPTHTDQDFNFTGTSFTVGSSATQCLTARKKVAGALLSIAPCSDESAQIFSYNVTSGVITAAASEGAAQLCVDSGSVI
jgi:hypothetical protein